MDNNTEETLEEIEKGVENVKLDEKVEKWAPMLTPPPGATEFFYVPPEYKANYYEDVKVTFIINDFGRRLNIEDADQIEKFIKSYCLSPIEIRGPDFSKKSLHSETILQIGEAEEVGGGIKSFITMAVDGFLVNRSSIIMTHSRGIVTLTLDVEEGFTWKDQDPVEFKKELVKIIKETSVLSVAELKEWVGNVGDWKVSFNCDALEEV